MAAFSSGVSSAIALVKFDGGGGIAGSVFLLPSSLLREDALCELELAISCLGLALGVSDADLFLAFAITVPASACSDFTGLCHFLCKLRVVASSLSIKPLHDFVALSLFALLTAVASAR
jgi:hypothetical protein